MSRLERLVQEVRPGVLLRSLAVHDDEVVLAGGAEVFRLPLAEVAVQRHAVLVRALPVLGPRLPVAVAVPRFVGVMPDGQTPFTAEPLLPGEPAGELTSIAAGQLAGVLAALAGVPAREARQWGVPGPGEALDGGLGSGSVLLDPTRGVLTGIVGWNLTLAG